MFDAVVDDAVVAADAGSADARVVIAANMSLLYTCIRIYTQSDRSAVCGMR